MRRNISIVQPIKDGRSVSFSHAIGQSRGRIGIQYLSTAIIFVARDMLFFRTQGSCTASLYSTEVFWSFCYFQGTYPRRRRQRFASNFDLRPWNSLPACDPGLSGKYMRTGNPRAHANLGGVEDELARKEGRRFCHSARSKCSITTGNTEWSGTY